MNEFTGKCYSCKHRGPVPGDAHSCCRHPVTGIVDVDQFGYAEALCDIACGRADWLVVKIDKLRIRANPHGVSNLWFVWPFSFDPVWLENCEGFEVKE